MTVPAELRPRWRRYLLRTVLPWFVLFAASGIVRTYTHGVVHEFLYWLDWAVWVVMVGLAIYGYRKIVRAAR